MSTKTTQLPIFVTFINTKCAKNLNFRLFLK